ncbi:hypothetical protein TPHA_0D03050 [Tetrapisispora phaffii CBS 4417]|uniref:V-type proton ATPase subunit S1/VOA1 transmembrane domain-containing protein n=1 Tax=Tetrapisispora phaffii (strain ATCC 24235 / CBS 4417 / NBRC 1672 / NRRL Y-8282 / UCD 70-5) TaxID=1071381 RepID=G8BSX0_TETPH|nr:hypothetical protein TPHA_0D03050 [Tetrapisispora phaffii CBS 4417]CCE62941.1 hypothetical protein TPHA_0D03050 [Tetrapisispora phaffii CBS 4417]
MVCFKSLFVLVFLQAALVNCLKTGVLFSNEHGFLKNTKESLLKFTDKQPTVVFKFLDYSISDAFSSYNDKEKNKLKYLTSFFEDQVVGVKTIKKPKKYWNSIKSTLKSNKEIDVKVITFKKLPETPYAIFHKIAIQDKDVIVLKFEDEVYDLSKLNDTLESVMNRLVEVLGKDIRVILFNYSNDEHKPHVIGKTGAVIGGKEVAFHRNMKFQKLKRDDGEEVEEVEDIKDEEDTEDEVISYDEKVDEENAEDNVILYDEKEDEDNAEDNDILSKIWTEGLLMCLLVSIFLFGLLAVALSWMTSLEISYGAFEKQSNPLKKTN